LGGEDHKGLKDIKGSQQEKTVVIKNAKTFTEVLSTFGTNVSRN